MINIIESIRNLYNYDLGLANLYITQIELNPGKLIGYFGTLMFGGRWAVQSIISHFAKRPVLPIIFWYMSFTGSLCLVSYFVFGKNDSVGFFNTFFPMVFTIYNIFLHYAYKKKQAAAGGGA
ncbi:MAG: lipid-A-disaccharide synthase N-terminal domain-containing protein [Verrucomicrobiales bacterium]|jgi:lipid-A-disaccharide synthase-like uncharacterized protein|nr:lipid-A-disaccharide synthase N-terminal domain-containing protein [Verrucomicrobiales bacterium]